VRLHIDAAGSLFLTSRRFVRGLRRRGVQVRWFHRWDWRHPWRYNRRNHRKLLVIDGDRAYLGGFNVHRENSLQLYGEERWRDSHICVRDPRLVARARVLFGDFWAGRRRRRDAREMSPHTTQTELVTNAVRGGARRLRSLYQALFHLARERLYVTTPYFVPDRRTQRALVAAAQRGVDVRLLVPAKTDVPIARWAARAAYAPLLEGGVKIYEYLPRVLHAKTVVIDGFWGLIGTANVDYRSFFLNYELVLFSPQIDLCRELETQFHADLHESVAVSALHWPQRAWLGRIAELIGWLARRLL
jgi:cardiolipin synthase